MIIDLETFQPRVLDERLPTAVLRQLRETPSPVARAAGQGLGAGDAPPRPAFVQPAGFRVQSPAIERSASRQGVRVRPFQTARECRSNGF